MSALGATNNGRTGVQFLDSLRMKTSQMLIAFGALLLAVAWVISGGAGSAVEEVYTRRSGHSNDSTLPADPSICQSGRGRPPFSAQVPLLPKACPGYMAPQGRGSVRSPGIGLPGGRVDGLGNQLDL